MHDCKQSRRQQNSRCRAHLLPYSPENNPTEQHLFNIRDEDTVNENPRRKTDIIHRSGKTAAIRCIKCSQNPEADIDSKGQRYGSQNCEQDLQQIYIPIFLVTSGSSRPSGFRSTRDSSDLMVFRFHHQLRAGAGQSHHCIVAQKRGDQMSNKRYVSCILPENLRKGKALFYPFVGEKREDDLNEVVDRNIDCKGQKSLPQVTRSRAVLLIVHHSMIPLFRRLLPGVCCPPSGLLSLRPCPYSYNRNNSA